jgi:hypothetical protein
MALLSVLALATFVPAAHAQYEQRSLQLNDPTLASQYVVVGTKDGLQGINAITIEAWVRPIAYTNYPTIVGNTYTSSYWLGLNTAGNIRYYPNASGTFIESAATVPLNAWSHVAATYDAATGAAQILLNGVVVKAVTGFSGSVGSNAGWLDIGADREAGVTTYYWRGELDEVRIWSAARTAAQISATMHQRVGSPAYFDSPAYAALVADWDVSLDGPNPMHDMAGGPGHVFHEGSVLGSATVSTDVPSIRYNMALRTTGAGDHAELPIGDGYSNGLTLSAWVAPHSLAGFPTIIGRDFLTSYWLGINPSGMLRFYPCGGSGQYIEGHTPLQVDTWTHVAASYHDGVTRLYFDGMLDAASTAITGPVGENGLQPWVGADDEGGVPGFPFNGLIDQPEVAQGQVPAPTLRTLMFFGTPGGNTTGGLLDERGVPSNWMAQSFDDDEVKVTGAAVLAPSGAPLGDAFHGDVGGINLGGFHGASGFYAGPDPNVLPNTSEGVDLFIPETVNVSSLGLWVSASASDLSTTQIQLRSPSLTTVNVLEPGSASGLDLATVFDDASPITLATGVAPFDDGVKPSHPLGTFIGEPAHGDWRITLQATNPAARVMLWAWGVRLNGNAQVSAGPPALPARPGLKLASANPVRGSGAFTLFLPRDARVSLALFDAQGRHARSLVEGELHAGTQHVGWNASGMPPGLYLARLTVAGETVGEVKVALAP